MQWLVLVEATRGSGDGVAASDLRRLLAALADPVPGALHSADRYALQFEVDAPGPAEAVRAVIQRWEDGLREIRLPRWELVRVEALTRDEFEQEFLVSDGALYDEAAPTLEAELGDEHAVEEVLLRQAVRDP
ncbi:MAG: hypothetical protein M3326_14605 [Actinomycetota bacterium]|nr:hypothetical protein [Actinomycetota bacterium]